MLLEKPNDVHSVTARKVSSMIGQDFSRSSAKNVKYASTYGAQAARIAKTVGCDLALGQQIFDAFWAAAEPLAKLKANVEKWWETKGGKKFIPGLDGRKINTRSQHALLNSLFQSAGVICAKRAMLFQDRLMTSHGLTVDFWKDDWKNMEYCQQISQTHDEQQHEISKSLIKWRKFESDDAANDFKALNKHWVGPLHLSGGVFLAYSIVNEIVEEAITLTNNFYKLNVPLGVDPQYGRTWAECH